MDRVSVDEALVQRMVSRLAALDTDHIWPGHFMDEAPEWAERLSGLQVLVERGYLKPPTIKVFHEQEKVWQGDDPFAVPAGLEYGEDGEDVYVTVEVVYRRNDRGDDRITKLQLQGHTHHCAVRMVFGDSECECGSKGSGTPYHTMNPPPGGWKREPVPVPFGAEEVLRRVRRHQRLSFRDLAEIVGLTAVQVSAICNGDAEVVEALPCPVCHGKGASYGEGGLRRSCEACWGTGKSNDLEGGA